MYMYYVYYIRVHVYLLDKNILAARMLTLTGTGEIHAVLEALMYRMICHFLVEEESLGEAMYSVV